VNNNKTNGNKITAKQLVEIDKKKEMNVFDFRKSELKK